MAQKKFIIDGGFTTNDDSTLVGNLDITGHIIPSVDSDGTTGYDLGSPDMKWRDLYLSQGSLYIDGQKVIESNSGTIVVQADPDQSLTTKVSGSGVMTLESATTVNMASTLQMQTGKKITDQGGNAVVFGDKVDMDQNQIINIGTPTADGHAANKAYVDDKFGDVVGGAPAALDTLNELANALGDDADYAASITTALSTKATTAYVDSQISSLSSSVAAGSYSDSDVADYLASGQPKTTTSLYPHANGNMIGTATNPFGWVVSNRLVAMEDLSVYDSNTGDYYKAIRNMGGQPFFHGQKYLPQQTGQTDLELEANPGGKINVNGFRVYNVGTPTDVTDAANKAYVDSAVAGLVGSAPGALDTLNELAAALGDDANFASATTAALATKATTAYVDGEITTLSASVAAGAYGDADVANYLTSGTVTSFEIRETSVDLAQATLTSTLTNPNSGGGTARDGFAYAIDSNDTHVIVGAYNEVGTSINSGVAYVYNLSDMSLAHTLINPDNSSPSSYDRFGYNLVMSNSYAMIGAPQDETSSTRRGTVYIYDTSDFSLKHSIPVPDVSNNPSFGGTYNDSFAIDDTHAVVGHGNYDTIYVIDLETGQIDGTITSSSYQSNFGRSVAMSSAYIAVADATNNSQVHVYNRSDLSHAYSISSPISAGDALGEGLIMTETYIIASAKRADVNGVTNVGAVHVFNIADGSLAYTIHNPNPATTQFSEIFAIDGSHLLVGDESSGDGGRAYIFDLANNGSLIKTFDNPNDFAGAASNDYFGSALTLKGETVVIGAYEEDDATSDDTGRVYVFKAPAAQSLFDIDSATSTLQIGADMTVGNTATFNSDVTISSTPTEPTHATNKAYVDSAVAGLVDSAPEALDTLNELAAALGDDANFSATVTNELATKATTAYVDSEISTLSASVAAGAYSDSDVQSVLDNRPSFADGLVLSFDKRLFAAGNPGDPTEYMWAHNVSGQMTLNAWKYAKGLGQTNLVLDAGTGAIDVKGARIYDLGTPTDAADATTKAYVDSEISTLSASVAAGAYGDSDLTDYLANNQTFFANIRANNTGSTVGTWADPFGQVNGKTIGLTEAIVWPSAASEHGSYKLVELVGQTGTGTIHAEFFPDVIKPGYSTGGNNVKLEPNAGGVVDVSNSKISNVSTPTDAADATTKAYVDSEVSTLSAAITSAEDAANAYTNTQVSNLINSAPGALDTLNELAAALGDDANFSSTVVNNIATAKSEAIATASADATAKADAAEADAIASAEAKDAVRATAANAYADQAEADAIATASADATAKADQAEADAIATASADATAKADAAEASAIATASADATAKADAALAALTHFHSAVQDVTSAQSTANSSGTVNFTFSELSGAKTYGVYLNRQLLRPAEYSVSGTTVTISTGVLATDDELEVTGLKV